MGNPLMNDAQLSQTADRAKTRQFGLLVKPTANCAEQLRIREDLHPAQWPYELVAMIRSHCSAHCI
jgi:hypothetical protein